MVLATAARPCEGTIMMVNLLSKRRYEPVVATAVLAALLALLGGCGGSEEKAAGGTSAASATAAAPPSPAAAGDDDCGDALLEIKASLTGKGDVTSVEVPTCAKAVVATSLGAGDGDLAASLCLNAASAASTHGVASVSVLSSDGKELAAGTNSEDCKPSTGS